MADFFFNELSLANRIHTKEHLEQSVDEFFSFCTLVKNRRHILFLHQTALYCCKMMEMSFQSALSNNLSKEKVSRIRSLIDTTRPALPADSILDDTVSVMYNSHNINNSALAECAARIMIDEGENYCYSLSDSPFTESVLNVAIKEATNVAVAVPVPNLATIPLLNEQIQKLRLPFVHWNSFLKETEATLSKVKIEASAKEQLLTFPFAQNVAEAVYRRLEALQEMADASPTLFQALYEKFCQGEKSWFSDSSTDEKREFAEELSFTVDGKKILCPFHGKVKIQQYRIHILGLPRSGQTTRVVYIGPKLTKR